MTSMPPDANRSTPATQGQEGREHAADQGAASQNRSESRKQLASAFATLARNKISGALPSTGPASKFERFEAYRELQLKRGIGAKLKLDNPFFRTSQPIDAVHVEIDGRRCVDFASYNYLGLNRHPLVNEAARDSIESYGTSALASRVVGGNRPVHRELEEALAAFYGVDDCAVFVSGYATNVTMLATLFGPKDLILYDELIHKSVIDGAVYSDSARRRFRHNSWQDAERILREERRKFDNVVIVLEGIYSMDGDMPNLPEFARLRASYDSLLMIDEAHSLGVLGRTGRGIREQFDVASDQVDIWMGTLSKTLASTGGFVAGDHALVEILKSFAPGFVYSVGLPPPMAAVAKTALDLITTEPERTARVKNNGRYFLETAKARGLDTGRAEGYGVIPILIGGSLNTIAVAAELLDKGFNAMPVIYPAVEEKQARLRFFVTSEHSREDIDRVLQAVDESIMSIRRDPVLTVANAVL